MSDLWRLEAEKYLAVKDRYRLVGQLDTEQFHPVTAGMAEWAKTDLPRAYNAIQEVDMAALTRIVDTKADELDKLTRIIRTTLEEGGNIQTYSMGSPFRASIILQHLWHQIHVGTPMEGRLTSHGTGGDVSFVVPVKGVEDHPEYGARQVNENGLRAQDLLIGFVEGGETPSVLGAVQQGTKVSDRNVQFLYCNPDDLLYKIGDVAAVHDHPKVDRYNLAVGPMALGGSTRMQATTVLELIIGSALFNLSMDDIKYFVEFVSRFDFTSFAPFTEAETATYENGEYTLYRAGKYAVTVASNHTELCPTFNIPPFENYNPNWPAPNDLMSPTYLEVIGTRDFDEAWGYLIPRKPETPEWVPGGISGRERFIGLDVSEEGAFKRRLRVPGPMHDFNILGRDNAMQFRFRGLELDVPMGGLHPLFQHLFLKMALNSHTTLMMGRMGKYESNYMYYVNAMLNYKLVDRGTRIIEEKFRRVGLQAPDYDQIVYKLFEMAHASTGPNDPPVPKTFNALMAQRP